MNPRQGQRLRAIARGLCLICLILLLAGQATTPSPTTPAPAAPATTPATPSTPAVPAPTTAIPGLPLGANVAVIPIHGQIVSMPSTLELLKYRLDTSIKNGATLVVLELHTPGGELETALNISRLIRASNVPTLAWVNTQAYSAGILIASACDAIVMAPTSAMGDCAPVQIVGGQLVPLPPTERAKILSPLLKEFADNASANDYDMALFQAMCILEVRVLQVRHKTTGELRYVNQDDARVMVDAEPFDKVAADTSGNRPVGMSFTLATPAQQGQWELVQQVHDGRTLLTVGEPQARDLGLSKAAIPSISQLQQTLAAPAVSILPITWAQSAAYWLSRSWVRAILVVVMLVAVYIEMQAPGISIGGIIATIALGLLVLGPMLAGIMQLWHVILVGVGVVLLLLEIFVTPGFGILGASGLLAMFIGLTFMGVPSAHGPFNLPPSAMEGKLQAAALWMVLAVIFSGVVFGILTRYFGQLPMVSKLTLTDTLPASMSHTTDPSLPARPVEAVSGQQALGAGLVKVGDTGKAMGTLRPSGLALIGDQVVDVITDGQWIDLGQGVRVIQAQGSRIVVERVES